MGLREYLAKLKEKKEKYKQYEEEMKIAEKNEERKISSNERELRRFMKEEREDSIKQELEEWRNKRKKEVEFGHQILNTPNMFSPNKNKESLLNQRNLFTGGNNLFTNEKKIFMR